MKVSSRHQCLVLLAIAVVASTDDTQPAATAVVRDSAGFRPTEITDSHVLGIWTDELDVESVRIFRLNRLDDGGRK